MVLDTTRTEKTPETGGKHANKGIYSRTIAETMLLYCLPIIGSYTGGTMPETSSDYSSRKQTARTLDAMPETETADQNTIPTAGRRKYINHSGIIGNAIPGSEKSAETVRS